MNDEIRAKFDRLMADSDALKLSIEASERVEAADAELRATVRPPLGQPGSADVKQKEEAFRKAFRNYLRCTRNEVPERLVELRTYTAMAEGTGSQGGFFVPAGFQYEIETALKAFGGMREVSRILKTETGNPLPWPKSDDTGTTGELIGENQIVSFANATISNVTFGAFKYSTKAVQVSLELLQDSAFDIEAYLKEQFVIRMGRITNNHFTVGVGTTQPFGIVTAATAGPTALTVGDVSYVDLVELEHSVDRAYRPGAKFMMNDSTLKILKQKKDSLGRPLWVPGFASKQPDTILGYEYVINQDMDVIGTGHKQVLFGAMNKYIIRTVKDLSVLRLDERYAELGQVAFIGFARYDGNLVDAGTRPVKYLVGA
jgi:HK97 family phage major capsid protein